MKLTSDIWLQIEAAASSFVVQEPAKFLAQGQGKVAAGRLDGSTVSPWVSR